MRPLLTNALQHLQQLLRLQFFGLLNSLTLLVAGLVNQIQQTLQLKVWLSAAKLRLRLLHKIYI
jgi:hypothetical protein